MPSKLSRYLIVQIFILVTWFFLFPSKEVKAAQQYTVSPGQSIQTTCLDKVAPGDTCQIHAGTYNESLTLKTSGTQTSRITIKNYPNETVIINSGSSKTTLITSGRISYYTIDGLRFISAFSSAVQGDFSLNFQGNTWDGETSKTGGNGYFIVKNCYVEGAILFYGHDNLVEGCELNGKGIWKNGLQDRNGVSHDNVYRNNIVHDYLTRGIWSMQHTDNITIEGNTVYNNGDMGIDCDAASNIQHHCYVRNNTIYNCSVGIELENTFDSVIENNTVYSVNEGIRVINYGNQGNWDPNWHADTEYRNKDVNVTISSNTIRNVNNNGIVCNSAPGVTVINNSIISSRYAIHLQRNGDFYCRNWKIQNNTISQTQTAYVLNYGSYVIKAGTYPGVDSDYPTDLGNFVLENNRYDFASTASKYEHKIWPTKDSITQQYFRNFSQMQQAGYELHSTTSDSTVPPTTPPKQGDVNRDGMVNITDFQLLSNTFSKSQGQAGYNDNADFVDDNVINIQDFVLLSNNFGR